MTKRSARTSYLSCIFRKKAWMVRGQVSATNIWPVNVVVFFVMCPGGLIYYSRAGSIYLYMYIMYASAFPGLWVRFKWIYHKSVLVEVELVRWWWWSWRGGWWMLRRWLWRRGSEINGQPLIRLIMSKGMLLQQKRWPVVVAGLGAPTILIPSHRPNIQTQQL